MPERILARIQVKRLFLGAVGVLGIVRGVSYIDPPVIPAGLRTIAQIPSLDFWGWAWVAVGSIALIAAFTEHYRTLLIPLMLLSAAWAYSYAAEWYMDLFVRGVDSRDYITAVSYLVQALSILVVIRLIDPAEVRTSGRGQDE